MHVMGVSRTCWEQGTRGNVGHRHGSWWLARAPLFADTCRPYVQRMSKAAVRWCTRRQVFDAKPDTGTVGTQAMLRVQFYVPVPRGFKTRGVEGMLAQHVQRVTRCTSATRCTTRCAPGAWRACLHNTCSA